MVGVQRVSLILSLIALLTGVVYLGPSFWVERGRVDGEQLPIVQIINSWGPVWPVLFIAAALVVALSAWTRRYVGYTHALVAGVWGFYGTAVLMSAVYAEPPLPVLSGGIAAGAALLHLAMIRAWADLGVK